MLSKIQIDYFSKIILSINLYFYLIIGDDSYIRYPFLMIDFLYYSNLK